MGWFGVTLYTVMYEWVKETARGEAEEITKEVTRSAIQKYFRKLREGIPVLFNYIRSACTASEHDHYMVSGTPVSFEKLGESRGGGDPGEECVVGCGRKACVAFSPCRHVCCCVQCDLKLTRHPQWGTSCPMCRKGITRRISLNFPRRMRLMPRTTRGGEPGEKCVMCGPIIGRKACVAFAPCMHVCYCESCSQNFRFTSCPMCVSFPSPLVGRIFERQEENERSGSEGIDNRIYLYFPSRDKSTAAAAWAGPKRVTQEENDDKEEAIKWYHIAADQGWEMPRKYVPKNKEEAIKWYRIAADEGLIECCNDLRDLLKGVEAKDAKRGRARFRGLVRGIIMLKRKRLEASARLKVRGLLRPFVARRRMRLPAKERLNAARRGPSLVNDQAAAKLIIYLFLLLGLIVLPVCFK